MKESLGLTLPQYRKNNLRHILAMAFMLVFLSVFVFSTEAQTLVLHAIYPQAQSYVHSRLSLAHMTGTHLLLTLAASAASGIFGICIGIAITHGKGKHYLRLIQGLNAFIQTFPPSAVVIIAVPFLGFGWEPTLFALFLYSLFPVLGNTVLGFQSIDPAILDASKGIGMSPVQRLLMVELPLAQPFILTGLRHAYILNLGTAAIGAVIGAGGLGTIIISGLTLQNSALVLSGTLVIVLLALIGEQAFSLMNKKMPQENT